MRGASPVRLAGSIGASAALALGLTFTTIGTALGSTGTVYVSPSGQSSNSGASCGTARYSTIQAGVDAAAAGATVFVCDGTYAEGVWVNKALSLVGDEAVINATGHDNGIKITASWVSVSGFTVWGATAEGILAQGTPLQITLGGQSVTTGTPVSHVRIAGNIVKNNDRGDFGTASANPECAANGEIPGDCGEGIHLMSAAWSVVANNIVHDNSGGILTTDEFGPSHDDLIANNFVYHNTLDCGITIPSHNLGINPMTHQLLPTIGGVYNITVRGNTVLSNGVQGFGAGVLVASPAPVTAVYNVTIVGNFASGNGLAGVTVHTHAPGAYLAGLKIVANRIGNNNVDGDGDAGDMQTTGILVNSPLSPTTVWIDDNRIFHDHFGIWLSANVTAPHAASDNYFSDVAVKVGP